MGTETILSDVDTMDSATFRHPADPDQVPPGGSGIWSTILNIWTVWVSEDLRARRNRAPTHSSPDLQQRQP